MIMSTSPDTASRTGNAGRHVAFEPNSASQIILAFSLNSDFREPLHGCNPERSDARSSL